MSWKTETHKNSPGVFVTEIEEVDEADVPYIVHGFAFFPDEE